MHLFSLLLVRFSPMAPVVRALFAIKNRVNLRRHHLKQRGAFRHHLAQKEAFPDTFTVT